MNKTDQIRPANRREFLRNGLRYALLTGLAVVSATLFKRSGGKLSGQTCINQGICPDATHSPVVACPGRSQPNKPNGRSIMKREFELTSRREFLARRWE